MAKHKADPDPRAANPAEPTGQNPKPVAPDAGNTPGRNDPMQASGDASPAAGPRGGTNQPAQGTAGGANQAGPLSGPAQTAPAQGPGATTPAAPSQGQDDGGDPRGTSMRPSTSGPEIRPTEEGGQNFPGMDTGDEPGAVGATLNGVIQHIKDATQAMQAKAWSDLSRASGNLLIDFGDVLDGNLTFLPTLKGATPGKEVQVSQEEVNTVRSDFDRTISDFERERSACLAIAPSVQYTGWHAAGGPASGSALPRATPVPARAAPGMVSAPVMQSNWLVFLLEVAPVLIDAIRKAISQQGT